MDLALRSNVSVSSILLRNLSLLPSIITARSYSAVSCSLKAGLRVEAEAEKPKAELPTESLRDGVAEAVKPKAEPPTVSLRDGVAEAVKPKPETPAEALTDASTSSGVEKPKAEKP